MVVQSGTVKTCETADAPLEGFKVGDKYIDLVLANAEDTHIYIKVTDLVDEYIAGEGIRIENHQVSVDTSKVAMKTDLTSFATKEALTGVEAKVDAKADKATTLSGYGITDGVSYVEVAE